MKRTRKLLWKEYDVYKIHEGQYGARINDQRSFTSLKDAEDCVKNYHLFVDRYADLVIIENIRSEIAYG